MADAGIDVFMRFRFLCWLFSDVPAVLRGDSSFRVDTGKIVDELEDETGQPQLAEWLRDCNQLMFPICRCRWPHGIH